MNEFNTFIGSLAAQSLTLLLAGEIGNIPDSFSASQTVFNDKLLSSSVSVCLVKEADLNSVDYSSAYGRVLYQLSSSKMQLLERCV